MLTFEWDENKNRINQSKHKISFEEAETVFYDERALLINDPDHSLEEERFIILGMSIRANLLIVCHCCRSEENIIRIISARKATKTESSYYGWEVKENEKRIWFLQRKDKPVCKKTEKPDHNQPGCGDDQLFQGTGGQQRHSLSDADQSVSGGLRKKQAGIKTGVEII